MDSEVNEEFHKWCNEMYGELKPLEEKTGKVHEYLRMTMEFGKEEGKCHVKQFNYVEGIIKTFPEEIKNGDVALTPASNDVFQVGESKLLNKEKRKMFHAIVAKYIFVAKRSRPDILPTISILSGRVRELNRQDWEKLKRLIKYLNETKGLHLVLHVRSMGVLKWHVDASFVHPYFKATPDAP